MNLVDAYEIEMAVDRVASTCSYTPVLPVVADSGRTSLWAKAESLQRTGSFKLRGATNAVEQLTIPQRHAGVVTYSAGNHGQAVAYAAFVAGVPATVVIPEGASQAKIDASRGWGAEVVLVPAEQRRSCCEKIAQRTGAQIIPPFDDARVIAGQGTLGLELIKQVPDVEVVLVPVGGGGLIAGVAAVVKASLPDVTIIGVEPELAGDLAEGFSTGERRVWPTRQTGRTSADGLRSEGVGMLNWEHIRTYVDSVVTVTEDAIEGAMRELALRCRIIAEPSGAVATAAYFEHKGRLRQGATVAIVSGGNLDSHTFADVLTNQGGSS